MNTTNFKRDAANICYAFLLIHNILMSFSTIDVPMWGQMVLLGFAGLFFCGYLWEKRYFAYGEIAFFAGMILLCTKIYLETGKMDMLYYTFLLFLLQESNIERFLLTDIFIRGSLTAVMFILSNAGFIQNNIYEETGVLRYGCGFNNPNSFGYMIFLLYLEYLVLQAYRKREWVLSIVILCIVSCILVWQYSVTRTSVILMILTAVVFLIRMFVNLKVAWLFVIPPLLTNVLINGYRNMVPFVLQINEFMTGRIRFFSSFLIRYPPTLFGNQVTYISSKQARMQGVGAVVCDNLYLFLLCNLGIVAVIIWGLGILLAIQKKKSEISLLFLLMICVYGIAENTMSNPMMFPAIVCIANAVSSLSFAQQERSYFEPSRVWN